MQGILGKKLGMTRIFVEEGKSVAVTVIEAGPCVVVQKKGRKTKPLFIKLDLSRLNPKRSTNPSRGIFQKRGFPR